MEPEKQENEELQIIETDVLVIPKLTPFEYQLEAAKQMVAPYENLLVTKENYKKGPDEARKQCGRWDRTVAGTQKLNHANLRTLVAVNKENGEAIRAVFKNAAQEIADKQQKITDEEKARQQVILDKIESIREFTTENIKAADTEDKISSIIDLIVKTDYEKQGLEEFLKDGEAMGLKLLQLATKRRDEIIEENKKNHEETLEKFTKDSFVDTTTPIEKKTSKETPDITTHPEEKTNRLPAEDKPGYEAEVLRYKVAETIFTDEKRRHTDLDEKEWETLHPTIAELFLQTAGKVIEQVNSFS